MKTTKISMMILSLLLIVTASSFKTQEPDASLCIVNRISGKLVFYNNEPTSKYETVFSFQNIIPNHDCISMQEIANKSVINAIAEAGAQSKQFDAVILRKGERDIAIKFMDKDEKKHCIAKANKVLNKYVFIQCEPVSQYELMDLIPAPIILSYIMFHDCPSHEQRISNVITTALNNEKDRRKKKGKLFDAIVYTGEGKNMSIKFK